MNEVPAYLKGITPKPTEPSLIAVSDKAKEVQTLMQEIKELEERLAEKGKELYHLTRVILPEMFNTAGIGELLVDPKGNDPGFVAKREPYFKANIAADWTSERKANAFRYLENHKAGGLIRASITALFPPKSIKEQKSTMAFLRKSKVEFTSERKVPWTTLTSWLKAEVRSGRMPDLEAIGGDVGEIVKLKPLKED